jgi:integrase
VYLEELLRFSLRARGLGKKTAKERADAIMEGVPVLDLRREVRRHTEFREMLILREEEAALWEAAAWPRARAYMAVSRDTACRKGELISARIMDMTHHDGYSELRVRGKTGERTMPLVRSVPALMDWLEAHPRPRPGAPLFATVWRGEARFMEESAPNKLMARLCTRAGLRRITPHMWRHTRLTEWARAGVGEYTLKSLAGWTPDSRMAARYIHLSGRDHVPTVLRLEGAVGGLDEYTRRALDTAVELMASDDPETRLFALRAFMQLNGRAHMQTTLDSGVFEEAVK